MRTALNMFSKLSVVKLFQISLNIMLNTHFYFFAPVSTCIFYGDANKFFSNKCLNFKLFQIH